MAVTRHHVGARLSEIAIHNNTVYLAGQVAEDTTADIAGQTREVLGHIDRLLAEANSDKTLLLSVQIFISGHRQFPGHEHRVGFVGRGRQHAAARHRGSQARESGVPRRSRGGGGPAQLKHLQ